jgi:hypothetical protein
MRTFHRPIPHPARRNVEIAACFCAGTVAAFAAFSAEFVHWFVLPVFLCGCLIVPDAVAWARGQRGLFDPVGVLGLLGAHTLFLAPLLHVALDHWMRHPSPPREWREWLGAMACLNAVGLCIYQIARAEFLRRPDLGPRRTRAIVPGRFFAAMWLLLAATAGLQVLIFLRYGGVAGYIASFEQQSFEFAGMGVVFMFSESFPMLALIGIAAGLRLRGRTLGPGAVVALLVAFVVVKMFFGGLRGSRSNTVWAVFWAAGIIHLWVRPFSRRMVAAGVAGLVLFMYVYGFYKSGGREGLERALQGADQRAELTQKTGRTWEATVLGDLGRADVQAMLLYRIAGPRSDYEPAYGGTYGAALTLVVPRSIWPSRPMGKVKQGTEALYGRGSWVQGRWQASQVYGLAGEAMLNFGPIAAPISFILLAAAVAGVARLGRRLAPDDARWLLFPFLVQLCFSLLVSDLDNMIFVIVSQGTLPAMLVFLGSAPARGAEAVLVAIRRVENVA